MWSSCRCAAGDRPNERCTATPGGSSDARGGGRVSRGLPRKTGAARAQESSGESERISITLSRNQVDHVVRAVLGESVAPNLAAIVFGGDSQSAQARSAPSARYRELQDNRRLSRSLLAGLLVLSCFSVRDADLGIKDISERLELNTSTVHRYVVTLVAAGLLERDPETRRYRRLAG